MKTTLIITATIAFLAASAAAQPCPGFPGCVYTPAQTYNIGQANDLIRYRDLTNNNRSFEITVREPLNRPGILPVVIWAHGGEDGRMHSPGALSAWSQITAGVGYLSVTPAFHDRNPADQQDLCNYLGLNRLDCQRLNSPGWDRPYDIKATIDWLTAQNQDPNSRLYNRVDLNRIAVGGHSAGSTATLSVAGAVKELFGVRYGGVAYFADPRPRAFIALSPSAPGFSSLFDTSFRDDSTSWDQIQRPVLMATGEGDAHEQFPHGRKIPYTYLPAGDKYRLFTHNNAFEHAAFGDDLGTCAGISGPACGNFQRQLVSSVLAFLDFYLTQPQAALASVYLQNGFVEGINPGEVEWLKK